MEMPGGDYNLNPSPAGTAPNQTPPPDQTAYPISESLPPIPLHTNGRDDVPPGARCNPLPRFCSNCSRRRLHNSLARRMRFRVRGSISTSWPSEPELLWLG